MTPAAVERIVKQNELIPAMLRKVEYEKVTQEQLSRSSGEVDP